MSGPHVVAVGGGHGLAASIRAVRRYAGRTTAVVATADDGGSTGRLRGALALPAPGDLRRCLVAMAQSGGAPSADLLEGTAPADVLASVFEYRFEGTDVEGHALGNLLIAGMAAVTDDFVVAVDQVATLLGLDPEVSRVLPATAEPVVLWGTTDAGTKIIGQVAVSEACGIDRVGLDPADAAAPAEVVEALLDADQIVLGPGSLFTSVLAAAVVDDIREAIVASPARRVYVCNLRTETGESADLDVAAHVRALQRHGLTIDVAVVQRNGLGLGDLDDDIEVITADVARPGGLAHDSDRLGAVLADLVPG